MAPCLFTPWNWVDVSMTHGMDHSQFDEQGKLPEDAVWQGGKLVELKTPATVDVHGAVVETEG